jgi:hypothetical protein
MKTLNAKEYKYLGTTGTWHVFKCVKENFDPEVLYLYRARVIEENGKSKFYDPINPVAEYYVEVDGAGKIVCEMRREDHEANAIKRLMAYSTRVKSSTQVMPNPRKKRIAST